MALGDVVGGALDYAGVLKEQVPPGGRNVLYRKRRARIEYYHDSTTVNKPKVIELTEVSDISITSAGSTAVSTGPRAAVMQPWYFQPFKIDVKGKSYMGAFSTNRLNVGTDTDIKDLLQLRSDINTAFANGTVDKIKVVFVYFDPNDASNLGVSQEYVGFIDDISISENQATPFIKDYGIKFTGELKGAVDMKKGSNASRDDRGLIAKAAGAAQDFAQSGVDAVVNSVKSLF